MSKKPRIEYESREENAFSLSTGDLMAGLLFIFILLLMGALLQVQEKAEEDKRKQKKLEPLDRSLRVFDTFEMQRLAEKCQNLQRKMQRKKIRCI